MIMILFGCTDRSGQEHSIKYGNTSAVPSAKVQYIFAVHPLHNSRRYFEVYQPLVDHINRHAAAFEIRLEASKDYSQFEEKLIRRQFHFALPNPYQSIYAVQYGYTIFGKMGDDDRFRGIIVVRKDAGINTIMDLKNSSISFPSATALAAGMMPKYFLQSNGLDVEKDVTCLYVGSQESAIMNVFLGKTKAGCTWPPPWESFLLEHPEVKDALMVRWKTDPLVNNAVVYRNDVLPEHAAEFGRIIFALHNSADGKEILKRINLSRFEPVHQDEYVRRVDLFLAKYQKVFGKLPGIGGTP